MTYDNTNRGAVWPNRKKETDSQPDFKGEANIEGIEYWVSAWRKKEGDNPKSPSLRLAFTVKENKSEQVRQEYQAAPSSQVDDWDDSIPF